jgi:predicted GIY-YIG superfamily endonuclease
MSCKTSIETTKPINVIDELFTPLIKPTKKITSTSIYYKKNGYKPYVPIKNMVVPIPTEPLSASDIERTSPHLCYILWSHVSNTIYVGYTNNFPHRIRQHNGEICGGAKRTHKHRPWSPLCTINGFYDSSSALRFEWRLQHCKPRKQPGENAITNIVKRLDNVIIMGDGTVVKDNKTCWPLLSIRWYLQGYNIKNPRVTNTDMTNTGSDKPWEIKL